MPRFETPEPISVTLEIVVGDIQIAASDRADTVVEVHPSDPANKNDVSAAEQIRVEFADGRLLVRAPKSGWRQWTPLGRGSGSIDVQIELPLGSSVFGGGMASVAGLRCTGRIGDCRYRTGLGEIRIDQAGSVELKTGARDVRITSVDGTAVVRNSHGDTWIGEVGGDVHVKAANGSISIDLAHAGVTAKTANGDIHLGEVERGTVVAQSARGSLDVGVRDGVAAWLDVKTSFGRVRNDLEAAERPAPREDAVEIHARTSFGDITIHRSLQSRFGKDEA